MPKLRDPLQFAYVKITMQGEDFPLTPIFKVFYVDDHKIRVRSVILENGKEVEGANRWVPWMAIDNMIEVEWGKNGNKA